MKKMKKWSAVIPVGLLLIAMSSCALAKGTYYSERKKVEGISLVENQKQAHFVYKLKTQKDSQIFNRINVSISNSKLTYEFGEYAVTIRVSLSKTTDFSENQIMLEQMITSEKQLSNLNFDFSNQTDKIIELKTNTLYMKVEIIADDRDEDFQSSWIVLGNINVSGGEKLEGEGSGIDTYFQYDFKTATSLEGLVENEGLLVQDTGITSRNFLQDAYFTIQLKPNDETNRFQALKLKMTNSLMKSYVKEDESIIHTEVQTFVATSVDNFPTSPSVTISSDDSNEITEFEVDLTSAVEKITAPELYVRVKLVATEDIVEPAEYLRIGNLVVEGQEGQRVDSYLQKNFKESNLSDAEEVSGFVSYKENEKQNKIILKEKGNCQFVTIEYDENGQPHETLSNVCVWREKGISYNNNIVAGLDEKGLQKVIKTYGTSLKDDTEHLYFGQIILNSKKIEVYIEQMAENYYELHYDLVSTFDGEEVDSNTKKLATSDARRFSKNVFEDYVMRGGGNVVEVIHDGYREIYVHDGKVIQRVSDNEIFRRK